MPTIIHDKQGRIVRRSRTTRGIMTHAGAHGVRRLECRASPSGGFLLRVLYANGDVGLAEFSSLKALLAWIRAKRLFAGVPIDCPPDQNKE